MKDHTKPYNPENLKPYDHFNGKNPSVEDYFANYPSAKRKPGTHAPDTKVIVVIGQHRYYNQFSAQLAEVKLTQSGGLKNPLTLLNPIDFVWSTQRPEELKFYAAITKFQAYYEKSQADLEGLKVLISNPAGYECYFHDSRVSEKISIRSISPIQVSNVDINFRVQVTLKDETYVLYGELAIGHTPYPLDQVAVQLEHFITWGDYWFFTENLNLLHCIAYFIRHQNKIRLSQQDFPSFQKEVLSAMETYVTVEHTYLKPLPVKKYPPSEKLIYLSDQTDYVSIHPVMKYDCAEIPVLSRQQLYHTDEEGQVFRVDRDTRAEDSFIALLLRQHPNFEEQLENPLLYFYLHKTQFLDQDWFLRIYDEWAANDISVLGFSEITGNKLTTGKASVSIQVSSGLNWFNAHVDVRFGKKKASLKEVKKAVKAKSRFVRLDDGTFGILPGEWLQKLEDYFGAGEVSKESIQIPKINFTTVSELYDPHMLETTVQEEINRYRSMLLEPTTITPAPIPEGLKGTLRPYQVQGLSWLNFLDDSNFGGCLADDMGLGKSIQILSFILLLRSKRKNNRHLLVVPTSLVSNWQAEVEKFAPSVPVHVHHGQGRLKQAAAFDSHELIITTYHTLISDVAFLRRYEYSYIFLDESQNIKNAGSQRYKAAQLLKSRNRIILSGTPIENNTFDLYAQFSFACPGLLGSRSFFRNTYAIPIDKFRNVRSAKALQQKIKPFILRRTKQEVAHELPEKTEITLHCEMGLEQRKIYDAYEREFREYISASNEEEIAKHPMHVLKGITRLRQICNAPVLIGESPASGSSKIEKLMEQIRNISKNHKVLVFSQFVSMLELIEAELAQEDIPCVCLTGKTHNRGEVVDRFHKDDLVRVFLISLKAGGTGLNLTAADYVFLVDPWWNPAVENQAIDRSHRIGQSKKVIAVRLICPDTVEEKIQVMQQNKSNIAKNLMTTNSFFKALGKKDLLKLAAG